MKGQSAVRRMAWLDVQDARYNREASQSIPATALRFPTDKTLIVPVSFLATSSRRNWPSKSGGNLFVLRRPYSDNKSMSPEISGLIVTADLPAIIDPVEERSRRARIMKEGKST